MKRFFAKISLFIVIASMFSACNAIKKVKQDELLLTKNTVYVNDKKLYDEDVESQIFQKPNSRFLSYPLRLNIYNLAEENPDSTFQAWLNRKPKRKERLIKRYSEKQVVELGNYKIGFNNWLKKTGEAPVIIDSSKTKKTLKRLKAYYQNKGFFNATTSFDVIPSKKERRASIDYKIETGNPYFVDSLGVAIASPDVDSIYKLHKEASIIKKGKQYDTKDFYAERDRLTALFRNSGIYNFQLNSIKYKVARDTTNNDYLLPVTLRINNLQIREIDTVIEKEYKVHHIKKVNIFTDNTFANRNNTVKDSVNFEDFTIYSNEKLRFRPKALTDAVFMHAGDVYKDNDRRLTLKHLNNLRTFKYPTIQYEYANDSVQDLIANIYLNPRKRFSLGFNTDITHSNIQDYGFSFSTSLISRNLFRGAETLEISARGTLGASRDLAESEDQFFNISEIGADLKLTFPRFFFPFNTDKIIPKTMSPTTLLSVGTSVQQNIGLDKQNFTGLIRYNWNHSATKTLNLELLNIQFIKNLNTDNYFNVYASSYNRLNDVAQNLGVIPDDENLGIPQQADAFLTDVLVNNAFPDISNSDFQEVRSINERKDRLTENNLIFSSSISYTKNNRQGITDNSFSQFRTKLEVAGNFLSAVAGIAGIERNSDGNFELFGVPYSQYVKTEFDYVKHWELSRRRDILAFRTFVGIAIPYGNSNNIPFTRSYFAGGSNDNRAWNAYKLGPGSSGSVNDFNEANLKIAANVEYRFDIFGSFKGALFADAGNIWNVLDNVEEDSRTFDSFSSLKDIGLGTGFGLRYDFSFFVLRFDTGFKTYDPVELPSKRWFRNYNFANAVFNIGINYPF